jgi:hypothetical protein
MCDTLVEPLDLGQGESVLIGQHGESPEGRQRRAALTAVHDPASGIKPDVVVRAFTRTMGAIVFRNAQACKGNNTAHAFVVL